VVGFGCLRSAGLLSRRQQLLQKLVYCCEKQAANTLRGPELESKAAFEDRHGFQAS